MNSLPPDVLFMVIGQIVTYIRAHINQTKKAESERFRRAPERIRSWISG